MVLEKSEIKKINSIDTLIKNHMDIMVNFSCNPDRDEYPYPKIGEVLDEDQSVRWNREKVNELRTAFDTKLTELQRSKNTALVDTEKQIKSLLQKEYKLTKEETDIIWANAYEEGHSAGISEVYSYFIDYVYMYKDLLKVRSK